MIYFEQQQKCYFLLYFQMVVVFSGLVCYSIVARLSTRFHDAGTHLINRWLTEENVLNL